MTIHEARCTFICTPCFLTLYRTYVPVYNNGNICFRGGYMKYYMTTLEKTVRRIYTKIGVNESNVPIDEIAIRLGVNLFYCNASFCANNSIFIDRNLSKRKQKEVFAHELCHCLYHVGNQLNMPDLYRQYQEFKASNFAMHFCVPTFMLQQIRLPDNKYHATAFIADLFCVTNEFALKRLDHFEKQLFGVLFHNRLLVCAEDKTSYSIN